MPRMKVALNEGERWIYRDLTEHVTAASVGGIAVTMVFPQVFVNVIGCLTSR